jgi:hypothetical protein
MKHVLYLLLIVTCLSACALLRKEGEGRSGVCCQESEGHRSFRGICVDDINGTEGLYNPERGFRLEVALDVANKNYLWNPVEFPDITSYLEQASDNYASDSVSLVQTYFYLTDLVGKDLSAEDFETMGVFFNQLRKLGKKAVLRFAYETEFMGRAPKGPTEGDILRHAQQLKPFLENNKDVIQVVQAGMIGAWGEWHSSVHGLEGSDLTKKNILEAVCCMTPRNRCIQVRLPEYKNLLKENMDFYNRLSFHDDFIVIKEHPWDGGVSEGTEAYNQIVSESPFLPVDGELPWGSWSMNGDPDSPEAGWIIDGLQTARRLFLQHYTSLSAIHNYKEGGGKYSMMYWKNTPITEEFLSQNKMPVSDGYFYKKDGTKVNRNVFEYIRDHLGYRIELQDIDYPAMLDQTVENIIEISLINRGFSTLFNEHPVYLVLINNKNKICSSLLTDADVNDWQPYLPNDKTCTPLVHKITAEWKLETRLPAGDYKIGLWIPDGSEKLRLNARYALGCANGNIEWWISPDNKYGVNILTSVKVGE